MGTSAEDFVPLLTTVSEEFAIHVVRKAVTPYPCTHLYVYIPDHRNLQNKF